MSIRGIIFDVNGTLIDINTDEDNEQIYRAISHYLKYHGSSDFRRSVGLALRMRVARAAARGQLLRQNRGVAERAGVSCEPDQGQCPV